MTDHDNSGIEGFLSTAATHLYKKYATETPNTHNSDSRQVMSGTRKITRLNLNII